MILLSINHIYRSEIKPMRDSLKEIAHKLDKLKISSLKMRNLSPPPTTIPTRTSISFQITQYWM